MVATHDLNDTTRSRTMEYDGLDRLVEAQSAIFGGSGVHRFEYDAVDNLMHWTLGGVKDYARYVYGADNRLARIEGTGGGTLHTFSHDAQGNVTDKDSTDYHFDLGNRLRAVVAPTVTETYRYDGHGRRVLAWTSAGSKLSMYSATGQILYQQLAPATQNKAIDYLYLSGSLVANREVPLGGGTAVVKYQHTDALGSPVAVTDSTGAVIDRTNYDPYGGVIGGPKDGVGYTGHVMDAGTGLHYMQQRYYDSATGSFLSTDPVTTDQDSAHLFSRYVYAESNPINLVDPDGREAGYAYHSDGSMTNHFTDPTNQMDLELAGDIAIAVGADILLGGPSGEGVAIFASLRAARVMHRASKIERTSPKVEKVGKFTKITETRPGKGPGQSRAEYVRIKNPEGKTIRTYKDSYDRAGKHQGRKPLQGGPEGRPKSEPPSPPKPREDTR